MRNAIEMATPVHLMPDWLTRQARVIGSRPALDTTEGVLSYQALFGIATSTAGGLRQLGAKPGDRVAVIARKGYWMAIAVHALMQCDVMLVPVNWRLTAQEVAWQMNDAEVKILLCDEEMVGFAREVADHMRAAPIVHDMETDVLRGPAVQRSHVDLRLPQAIVYTSGTTGHPKGTLLSYQNHYWSAMASAVQLGVLPEDSWLVPMPLFHVGGLSVLMRSVIYGTTAVVHDKFDPNAVNSALESGHVSMVSLVPAMLQRIIADRTEPYSERLRFVLLGGSAATRPLLERCQALSIPVAQSYGLTETDSQVATLRPEDGLRKIGSSGKPLLPTEIAVIQGNRGCLPGEVGEITVKGPTVTHGYLNRPDATRDAIRDGWLHTGDLGYLDEEGYLYVLDRRSDLIVSGGENIYPAEVESVLAAHPDVIEAAVVGRLDETWGAVPVAYVRVLDGCNPDVNALLEFCRSRLAKYKIPKAVYFVDELPRNASGKLLRRVLKERDQDR